MFSLIEGDDGMDEKVYRRREPRPEKVAVVEEIKEWMGKGEIAVLVNFQGMNVAEINELRRRFRQAGVKFKVYKNTLLNIAFRDLDVPEEVKDYLFGPTAVAFCQDATVPAKVLKEFIEEFDKPQIKGAILGLRRVIDAEAVQELAKLPPKEELVTKLLNNLNAPVVNLIYTLNSINPARGLVNVLRGTVDKLIFVLRAIAEKKGKAA